MRRTADGTYAWNATTLVTVHVSAGDARGFGHTYGSAAGGHLIRDQLAPRIVGVDALATERAWNAFVADRAGLAGIYLVGRRTF